MKTFLFALLSIPAFAQDDLKERILKLEINQKQIQMNLEKSHRRLETGTFFLIAGAVTTTAAIALYNRGLENGKNNWDNIGRLTPSPVFLCIGGGLMVTGTVIQIDAHKWIGRAGRRK
jgi:hypothetical protein